MLSSRLKFIADLALSPQVIWDIGCDHGLLGLSFKDLPGVEEIHLVDPSKDVIDNLILRIDSDIPMGKIFIHHNKGQKIKKISGKRNTFFIAGMGGKEIKEILESLIGQLSAVDEVVISPHRNWLELRNFLFEGPYRLMDEQVVCEGGHFYQVLKLSIMPNLPAVSLYGEKLWHGEVGEAYKAHLISHFQHHRDVTSLNFVRFLRNL